MMAIDEQIPADFIDVVPARSKQRATYDMTVELAPGGTVSAGVLARLPQLVSDRTFAFDATVRLVLEVVEK